jgi:glycosyltransferase involved in cell wall biosynthesis
MFGVRNSDCEICPAFIDFRQLAQTGESEDVTAFPINEYRFGFVGRLASEKQPQFAIRAFAVVHSRHSSTRLTMVGDGPLLAECKRLVADLRLEGSVDFLGATDRVGEIYRDRLDCLLVPSLYEGQCRVAAEAQFFGCKVMCSDALPIQAFLTPDDAVRMPSDDIDLWAEEMLESAMQHSRAHPWTIEAAESHPVLGRHAGVQSFLALVS